MEPIALVVLAERLRADAAETVRYLVSQGITIKVLSGDAPETVAKVAQRVGVPTGGVPRDARELIDDEDIGRALDATNVLGRVRPEQKLAAVRILQSAGHIVAMVGDGVNDVQALKQADLGIAMGSGSQSSRSVARVVLLDSAFSAVPRMLAEGRRVIANIERVANLFVTKTVYAALLAVVVAITAVPYPFFPRHLTIVSTFTIGIPGFFLALAGGAPRAVSGFAKRVFVFTLPAGIAAATATLAVYSVARAIKWDNADRGEDVGVDRRLCRWHLGLAPDRPTLEHPENPPRDRDDRGSCSSPRDPVRTKGPCVAGSECRAPCVVNRRGRRVDRDAYSVASTQ